MTHELRPGCSASIALLPVAPTVPLRFSIAGSWGAVVAEFGAGHVWGWNASVASRCSLRDPLGRSAAVNLQPRIVHSDRVMLSMQLEAPLWIYNHSDSPLQYQLRARFGRRRKRSASSPGQDGGHGRGSSRLSRAITASVVVATASTLINAASKVRISI